MVYNAPSHEARNRVPHMGQPQVCTLSKRHVSLHLLQEDTLGKIASNANDNVRVRCCKERLPSLQQGSVLPSGLVMEAHRRAVGCVVVVPACAQGGRATHLTRFEVLKRGVGERRPDSPHDAWPQRLIDVVFTLHPPHNVLVGVHVKQEGPQLCCGAALQPPGTAHALCDHKVQQCQQRRPRQGQQQRKQRRRSSAGSPTHLYWRPPPRLPRVACAMQRGRATRSKV